MQEEFFIGVMVCKPAKGGPGKGMKDPVSADKTPDGNMIGRVSVKGYGDDVELEHP